MKNGLFLAIFIFLFSVPAGAQSFVQSSTPLGIQHSLNTQVHWGAGVSFFDFDNDGLDDITLLMLADSARFYKNMGGYFQLLPSFVYVPGRATQIIWVDYDNDGDNDFFLSTFGVDQCRLFNNNGNMQFTDVTISSGLFGLTSDNYGASFADYDKDGDLDMYLCRYYGEGNPNNPLLVNRLFRNNGNGTFTDVTVTAGVGDGIKPSFFGAWFDYNNDTWPDLYVINDRGQWDNTFYRNNGNGTFSNVTAQTNTAMVGDDPMSATFEDFDHDGDNDFYSTNTGGSTHQARFLVAQANFAFTEEAVSRNVNNAHWAWGSTFIDVDNNTWQDLYVTTGTIGTNTMFEVRNYLYMSQNGLFFVDSPQLFSGSSHVAASYAVAKGDINNDGFADMVVCNAKGFASWLWLNTATSDNNYIKVTLEGTLSNRMAIGSWIRVYADGNVYSYYTRCGENYCSQNSQHHIFGMGQNQIIDSISVTYLSGITDVYYNLDVNQHYYFTEGETLAFDLDSPSQTTICQGMSVELTAPTFTSYNWSNGANTQSISITESGSYSLTAINQFGHIYYSDTVQIDVMNPVYIEESINDVNCFGAANGSIELIIVNQTDNYSLEWSTQDSTTTLENLSAGIYNYFYEDEFGCTFEGTVNIDQPSEILIFTDVNSETSFQLGSIQVLAAGGEPPYMYSLNGQNMTSNPMDVASGTYQVSVIDQNGCEVSTSVTVGFIDFTGISSFNGLEIGVYPNPTYNNEIMYFGFSKDEIVGLFDVSGRQIPYEIDDAIIYFDSGFKGVAQLIFTKDGVQYAIRIIVL
jgi:hypothetical protein